MGISRLGPLSAAIGKFAEEKRQAEAEGKTISQVITSEGHLPQAGWQGGKWYCRKMGCFKRATKSGLCQLHET